MKTRASTLVGVALTVIFLILAVRNVDLTAIVRELALADYRLLPVAAMLTLSGYLIRTLRWQTLLRPVQLVGWRALFGVLMLGFAANNLLPARVGEVVRAYSLRRSLGVSASLGLATIIVERVFDGLTLLALMALALQVAPVGGDDERLQLVEVAATLIFAVALIGLIALLVLRARALLVLDWLLRPLPIGLGRRVRQLAESFLIGLECLRHPPAVLQAAGLSLAVWTCEAASYATILWAFDLRLSPAQHLGAVLFLLVFVNLGIMIPSAPGYIGTFQFFARLALAPFGVAPAAAVGLAVLSHAMQYILVTGIGLAVLWRGHLSLARLLSPPVVPDSGSG